MIDQATIDKAAGMLLAAAPPGSKVILFGSHARGQAGPDSDLDFLVVEPEAENVFQEMVRLRKALRPLPVSADILVVTLEEYECWKDTPSTVPYDAAHEGRAYEKVA
jgi:predicted nucleotidyltransferase